MKKFIINILVLFAIGCNSSDESASNRNEDSHDSKNEYNKVEESIAPNIIDENEKYSDNKIKSISELWNIYKSTKVQADSTYKKDDLEGVVKYCEESASAAMELNRGDLASEQLNKIGSFSVDRFSKNTDYYYRIQSLAVIEDPTKREEYHKATKQVFRQNYKLLLDAEPYLLKAHKLDRDYKYSSRTESINKNLEFIRYVRKFLRTKSSNSLGEK